MKSIADNRTTSIALCINLAHGGWRDFLAGFLDATRSSTRWSLRIVEPSDFTPEKIDELEKLGTSGIVVGHITKPATQRLLASTIPLVMIGSQSSVLSQRAINLAFVHHDDVSIGDEGANALARLGNFSSWAFLPAAGNPYWSELRQRGFAHSRSCLHRRIAVFRCPFARETEEYEKRLCKWAESLPKPAAVMAACDKFATDLLAACQKTKINVPRQVSVIGVDNDTLLCETTSPTLSSVAPDHIEEGRLAARTLTRLLSRRHNRPITVLCSKKTTVIRESTSSTVPATTLIRRALEFVKAHAAENIGVNDIVAHLGVSRSLVELRFRQFHEKSLAKVILETRLQEVRRRLLHSSATFISISKSCGWSSPNVLKNAFRRHFGMSMREMRKETHTDAVHSICPRRKQRARTKT